MLDGDNVRHGLNRDLGFTNADRVENIRRVGEVAKLMTDAGLDRAVLLHLTVPRRTAHGARNHAWRMRISSRCSLMPPSKSLHGARPPRPYTKRALAGEIKNFTGMDQAYEIPENPEITLLTAQDSAEVLAQRVIEELRARMII